MNDTKNTYCRLCAELKPHSELKNLQTDAEMCHKIINRLARLNIRINLNKSILPKTVCLLCIESLDQAFDFVTAVEKSQTTLKYFDLVQQIKRDDSGLDEENIAFEVPTVDIEGNVTVKNENVDEATDVDNECIFKMKCESQFSDPNYVSNSHKIKVEVIDDEQSDVIDEDDIKDKDIVDDFEANKEGDNNIRTENDYNSLPTSLENTDESLVSKKINRLATLPLKSIKMTWAEYNWKCSDCETQFPNIDELRNHSMQYHNCCNRYACSDCNRKVQRLDSFLKHVRMHRKYLHYSCYRCYTKLSNLPEATKHYKTTHMKSDYICAGCHTNFSSEDELNEHVRVFYKKTWLKRIIPVQLQSDSLTCKVCNKTLTNKTRLNKHMLIHTDRTRDYTCELCGKSFFDKVTLAEHMIVHTDLKPHQCEICKFSFRTIYQLRYHATTHTSEKPFACEQCGKCFRLKCQLNQHSRTHTDSLPYVCTICNKRCRLKKTLIKHVRQHTGEKPYSCDICQRDFADWGNCNKHMKRIHGMNMTKKKRTLDEVNSVDPVVPVTDKVTKRRKDMTELRKIELDRGDERLTVDREET